eukprot:CAMPEP_0173438676 /NCGR_PEP_ID=MMETSP1357-20121228/20543_1 /TAXON_ID=77926 /ORGANISM="Hemiselmis rufescens, Strain PCC563" /LENGTH=106 /DNA_ID=CAMNT_0014403987 /DNA_START=323 /DNA_END=643 /DNA_ORIENTATION=+
MSKKLWGCFLLHLRGAGSAVAQETHGQTRGNMAENRAYARFVAKCATAGCLEFHDAGVLLGRKSSTFHAPNLQATAPGAREKISSGARGPETGDTCKRRCTAEWQL